MYKVRVMFHTADDILLSWLFLVSALHPDEMASKAMIRGTKCAGSIVLGLAQAPCGIGVFRTSGPHSVTTRCCHDLYNAARPLFQFGCRLQSWAAPRQGRLISSLCTGIFRMRPQVFEGSSSCAVLTALCGWGTIGLVIVRLDAATCRVLYRPLACRSYASL